MMFARTIFVGLAVGFLLLPLVAQEPVALISTNQPVEGWTFNNGQEFPGAKGSVSVDPESTHEGKPTLKLVGDFTKGGKYVVAGRKIPSLDIRELTLWVKSPEGERFTLRINDASGQTHQIDVKLQPQSDWQKVVLPLERFFASRGQSDAVTSISRYESWGGAKDGQWHGPATAIYFLVSERTEAKVRTLWLSDISIAPKAKAVAGVDTKQTVSLGEEGADDLGWNFTDGPEFKGATGSLTVGEGTSQGGQKALKLAGDFTGGGAYVAATRNLKDLEAKETSLLRFKVKTANATTMGIQMVDGTGQTHQQKGTKLVADGNWQTVEIIPAKFAGGEHWGGAKDGRWHGALTQLVFSVTERSDAAARKPEIWIADVEAEIVRAVFVQAAAYRSDFNEPGPPTGWTMEGDVTVTKAVKFQDAASLQLSRTLEQLSLPVSATGPLFPVSSGKWQIGAAVKADLTSQDSSYNGVLTLECLDRSGKLLDRLVLADVYGKREWKPVNASVDLPAGAAQARFQVQLNKTWGQLHIASLSAAYLSPMGKKDDRISRVLFATAQLGNLLFPQDSRVVTVTVEATKPLAESQSKITCVVQDYWGAEQAEPVDLPLKDPVKKDGKLQYNASLDLSTLPLETGRYYEVHASIPHAGQEPFKNRTSLAIFPEAVTRKYKPEEVPFTSRNWDNRPPEYIRLSDRLGVRICGLWGGWSAKPPYKAEAPGLELCKELGMGWLTTTPVKFIEDGRYDHNETSLKEGVRNLITQYGNVRPLIINLGNEPHGKGEKVKRNVAGYKAVYEEVKRVAPDITVVATSVEPNEEYFSLGYGQWCDAFDFHIYESAENVRRTIGEYRELMKKYDCVKPIWSTELGLNSQGQTRRVVAGELYKKFATFFAAGGTNVSWFGLLYPDPDGKSAGSSGDSHNVFDCRYKRYAPRLDAIAYYNAVNSIAIKKFTSEQLYEGGIRAMLFRDRDGQTLQVLWKDKGRQDVGVPLPGLKGGSSVEVIGIDGTRRVYDAAAGGAVTLTVSEDPVLVLYQGGAAASDKLPATLSAPQATVEARLSANAAKTVEVAVTVNPATKSKATLQTPPYWTVKPIEVGQKGSSIKWLCTPPAQSAVRIANLTVKLEDEKGAATGALGVTVPLE